MTRVSFALALAALAALIGCAPPTRPFSRADVQNGKRVFEAGCAVCHYSDRTATKVGPGLKGLFRAAALPNGQPVSDDNVRNWIKNGGGQMPSFRRALNDQQIEDVVGYLKTL